MRCGGQVCGVCKCLLHGMMPDRCPGALLRPAPTARPSWRRLYGCCAPFQESVSLGTRTQPRAPELVPMPSPASPQPGAVWRDRCFLGEESGLELIKLRLIEV